MSATSIYFNGRMTRIPGSYSEVDASGLDSVGLGASGYVAIVGTAIGGKPYDDIDLNDVPTTIQASTKPGKAKVFFRGGNLLKSESLAFNPSNDPVITAGAQKVFWLKVNKSTQSTATFANGDGSALVLTSEDWGFHTTQIAVQIATGTVGGKKYTITFEDTEEVFDNIGYTAVFKIKYLSSTPAQGFTTCTLAVSATALTAAFTRTQVGLDTDVTSPINVVGYAAAAKVEVVSSSTADITQIITIYGVSIAGVAIREDILLTGTTFVLSTNSFNDFHGAKLSAACAGTVIVRNISAGTTITSFAPAALTKACGLCTDMAVSQSVVSIKSSSVSGARRVTLVGLSEGGLSQVETIKLNGTTYVPGTLKWSKLLYLAVGDIPAAMTITVAGTAVSCLYSTYDTIKKCADKFGSTVGFFTGSTAYFEVLTGNLSFEMSNMDIYAATSILSPLNPSFYSTLYDAVTAINSGSGLVTAARAAAGTSAPSNTTDPVFLSGGHEGSTTPGLEGTPYAVTADWQAAIDVLTKIYVNSVVVLTADPAIHAYLKDHCSYMCGAGRMERDGQVGLQNAAMTGLASKTEIKSQVIALNTRHLRAVAQNVDRYNVDGELETMEPYFLAVMVAGMQAGASVGEPLTHKYLNGLAVYGASTWHPQDDADEMLEAGLMFAEVVDGVGRRWVRNITTHLSTSNIAYTEGSVNQASNYAAYNFRTQMEFYVGSKGFSGSIMAADGTARETLRQLMADVLTAWRSLDIDLVLDVMEVSVEMAPVLPINFVKNTIHLIAVPISNS